MKKYFRVFLYAFLMWVVPYIASLLFLPLQDTDKIYFKTIMIIIGSLTWVSLIYIYFKDKSEKFLLHGLLLGGLGFGVGILLDMIGVLPFSDISFVTYMKEIGFRYLLIPISSICIGFLLKEKSVVKNSQSQFKKDAQSKKTL